MWLKVSPSLNCEKKRERARERERDRESKSKSKRESARARARTRERHTEREGKREQCVYAIEHAFTKIACLLDPQVPATPYSRTPSECTHFHTHTHTSWK